MTVVTNEHLPIEAALAYRSLINEELWGRLVGRIMKDHGLDRQFAARILNEALGFLKLCATMPVERNSQLGGFRPSHLVDIGWHTFLLYTKDYAEFCERQGGHFIHHNPSDVPGMTYPTLGETDRTLDAMRVLGPVDEELWAVTRADCSDHCGGFVGK